MQDLSKLAFIIIPSNNSKQFILPETILSMIDIIVIYSSLLKVVIIQLLGDQEQTP